jgi:8-oxo-dGTP pyrophosphatase MutT (NUDIX family)
VAGSPVDAEGAGEQEPQVVLDRPGPAADDRVQQGVGAVGERIAETVVREVREETGLDVEMTGIVGVYSDPGHVIAYSDGDVRQEFNLCFAARLAVVSCR